MRVVIVGAGPAGAATALLLARRGVEVTLVERERHFDRVFRGEALMPSGLDALHQMGLREKLNALPWRHIESWEIYLERQPVMCFEEPVAELGDLALRVVGQPRLLELFVAEAAQCPTFTFRSPVSVRSLLRNGSGVCGVKVTTPQGEEEIRADLTIGADGRSSLVRTRAGLELTLLPESYDVLWFKAPIPERLEHRCPLMIFASGPEVALAYVSWDGSLHVAWLMDKGQWGELKRRDWLADVMRLLPEWLADHLDTNRQEIEAPRPLDVIVGRCPRWSAPGLLLLGDAAHPMSPVRAQGINIALRDAIVAANHLVPTLLAGQAPQSVLQAIQGERDPEIIRAQHLQYREMRGQRWARQRPWLMKPMLKLAPLILQAGFVRRFMQRSFFRQQRELRFGVKDVRLH